MRSAKRNARIFLSAIVSSVLIATGGAVYNVTSGSSSQITAASSLETILGRMEPSIGYAYGGVYSLTGESVAGVYDVGTEDNPYTLYAADAGYTSVVGNQNGLLIAELENVLLSSELESNRLSRTGDAVITTLHALGQSTAVQQLSAFDSTVEASLCFVLYDGSVVVSAGNNSTYPATAILDPDANPGLYVNYNELPLSKGSSFKPITVSTLLEASDVLDGTPYSLSNDAFEDISCVDVNGTTISNYDATDPSSYEIDCGDYYARSVSLSEAMQHSSNTYMLRHAQYLGFSKFYASLQSLYGLDKEMVTDISALSGLSTEESRIPWLAFGQDAYLSATRLCAMYNYTFSGDFYTPFYVAQVLAPDGSTLYQATPTPNSNYTLDAQKREILKDALCDCFTAYTGSMYADLAQQRRILCKSGTAEVDILSSDGTITKAENRVMMLTILDTDGRVIASGCACVNHTTDSVSNVTLIQMLLETASAMGML